MGVPGRAAGVARPRPAPTRPSRAGGRRLRLAGGPGRCAGRVEVYVDGAWSSVCRDAWSLRDAAVVCRQLRCGTALEAPGPERFGSGPGTPWAGAGGCAGTEAALWDCPARRDCGGGGGAAAVCSGERGAGAAVAVPPAVRSRERPVPWQRCGHCARRAAAAEGSWSCCTTARGAPSAPTAPWRTASPRPRPPPCAASWAAEPRGACTPSRIGARAPPGWDGCAARKGAARSGAAPRRPGARGPAGPPGSRSWPAMRTEATWPAARPRAARIGTGTSAQVALPCPPPPLLGGPRGASRCPRCPRSCPAGRCAAAHRAVRAAGDAAEPGPGCPGRADAPRSGSACRWGSLWDLSLLRTHGDPVVTRVLFAGPSQDAGSEAVYEELDYSQEPECWEGPSRAGGSGFVP